MDSSRLSVGSRCSVCPSTTTVDGVRRVIRRWWRDREPGILQINRATRVPNTQE
jgi:hypothetical protein